MMSICSPYPQEIKTVSILSTNIEIPLGKASQVIKRELRKLTRLIARKARKRLSEKENIEELKIFFPRRAFCRRRSFYLTSPEFPARRRRRASVFPSFPISKFPNWIRTRDLRALDFNTPPLISTPPMLLWPTVFRGPFLFPW